METQLATWPGVTETCPLSHTCAISARPAIAASPPSRYSVTAPTRSTRSPPCPVVSTPRGNSSRPASRSQAAQQPWLRLASQRLPGERVTQPLHELYQHDDDDHRRPEGVATLAATIAAEQPGYETP